METRSATHRPVAVRPASPHTDPVRRLIAGVGIALLVAACGQRAGIHQRFAPQFTQQVSASDTAHGESAKTRDVARVKTVRTFRERVPRGHQILRIAIPSDPSAITWPQWGALLLDRLHAPRCANNIIAIVAWTSQEGTSAGWNPLATTYDMPGASSFNSVGVRNYGSLEQGLDATVATLQKGLDAHGYRAIVEDLRLCADPVVTATAINASDWCHGCAGGAYVLGVVPNVIASYVESLKS